MLSIRRPIAILALLAALLSACNMPRPGAPPQSGAGAIYTAAAQTLTAVSQQTAGPSLETSTPPVPGNTPQAVSTATPPAATPAAACDQVRLVDDVTYPDNTLVAPGVSFVKTWRLQNTGTCTWDASYALVFSGGDALGAPASVPLTSGPVAPGDRVDVSVTLQAPQESGRYRGDWKLRNASNEIFGLGRENNPFWVQIRVGQETPQGYDFVARASSAEWTSGVGNDLNTRLTFGGADDDPNGAAKHKQDVEMETGAQSGKLLFTVPKQVEDGVIQGFFSEYTVHRGDEFKARLGFLANPEGGCGTGEVTFQLKYREGDQVQLLGEWDKECTTRLLPVSVSLARLEGRTVQFIFVVLAGDSPQDDWAIWNSPRIE